MKKYLFLSFAALAVGSACGDGSTTRSTEPRFVPGGLAKDDIYNGIDATIDADVEVMELTVGAGDGSTLLKVQPKNGDGDAGCNLEGTTELLTVAVTSSDPNVATVVSASPITWGSCNEKTVTIHPVAQGSATISLSLVSNNSGGSFELAPATFRVDVAAAPVTDATPPVIGYVLTPASPDGDNNWYKSNVSVDWTVSDPESSILNSTGCADFTITADQSALTYTCSATSAGGTNSVTTVFIKRDATAPTNVAFLGGPAAGSNHYFGSVPPAPTCTADDATSQLASCVVTGYSNLVGTHTLTATATDYAGNQSTATRTFTVDPWRLAGFYQPVDMYNVVNSVKSGSTVPFKFEVFAGSTELTDVAVVKSFITTPVACATLTSSTDEIESTTTGGTSLRYDATGGQFIQNWQTVGKAGACFKVTLTTQDLSALTAYFKLK